MKFKYGCTVQVKDKESFFEGLKGKVIGFNVKGNKTQYLLEYDNRTNWFYEEHLESKIPVKTPPRRGG